MADRDTADRLKVMGQAATRGRRRWALALCAALLATGTTAAGASGAGTVGSAGRAAPPATFRLHGGGVTPAARVLVPSSDYRRALWEPASTANYSQSDRGVGDIRKLVIHVAEGGFSSTYQWFKNPRAQASAHYVVSSTGEVAQMVPERDIAWHAGNWDVNVQSIGIEHAGYTNRTHFPDVEYRASARLAGSVAARYLIPPDRRHVIGHSEVPDPFHRGQFGGADHHTDPGGTWNWPRYMAYLRLASAQTWSSVVDDADAGVAHGAAWTPAAGDSSLGGGYLRTSSHRADPVTYTVGLPHDDTYDVFVRWPCTAPRATGVRVTVHTAQGAVRTTMSQKHCRTWRYVGSWPMAAGRAPRVDVGSHSGNGAPVAADGVRFDEATDPVAPASVRASATAAVDGLSVTWPASHDAMGVGAYQLWVDGERVYEGAGRAATVSEPCGTTHTLSVRAVDLAGNRSGRDPMTAATDACPNPVINLHTAAVAQTSVTLAWQNGGGTVSGYLVYFTGGALIAQTASPGYTVQNLTCGTGYRFSVRATDAVGDRSPRSVVDVSTAPC